MEGGRAECATEGMDALPGGAGVARSAFKNRYLRDTAQVRSFLGRAGIPNPRPPCGNTGTKRGAFSTIPAVATRDIGCTRSGLSICAQTPVAVARSEERRVGK